MDRPRGAETVTRGAAPQCPLLLGPSGCGKTAVARAAAGELAGRGLVRRLLDVHGAAVCSGAIFWPERDEKLRQTLEAVLASGDVLLLMEEFDLAIARSEAAAALVAEALDRGLKLIAVSRPEMSLKQLGKTPHLARRLEPIAAGEPDREELFSILRGHVAEHPRATGGAFGRRAAGGAYAGGPPAGSEPRPALGLGSGDQPRRFLRPDLRRPRRCVLPCAG